MDSDLTEYNNGQYVRPKNEQIALYQPTLHDEISHMNKRHNSLSDCQAHLKRFSNYLIFL